MLLHYCIVILSNYGAVHNAAKCHHCRRRHDYQQIGIRYVVVVGSSWNIYEENMRVWG